MSNGYGFIGTIDTDNGEILVTEEIRNGVVAGVTLSLPGVEGDITLDVDDARALAQFLTAYFAEMGVAHTTAS